MIDFAQQPHTLQEIAQYWWAWMAPMTVHVAVLFVIVAVLDRLLSHWSIARLHVALWSVVIAKLVIPPTISSPVSVARLTEFAPAIRDVTSSAPTLNVTSVGWPEVTFVVWAIGAIGLAAWYGVGYLLLRRRINGGLQIESPVWLKSSVRRAAKRVGLRRIPRIVIREDFGGAAMFGVVRPVVLIPAEILLDGPSSKIEHMLLHEMAHVRRRDPVWSFVCLVLQIVYWFHPLVWVARRRLATLREIGCDGMVAHVLGDTAGYRETLLAFASRVVKGPVRPEIAFFHHHSQLLARLEWLDRPLQRVSVIGRVSAPVLFIVLMACCVPLALPESPVSPIAVSAANTNSRNLDSMAGCLRLRYSVLRMLADEAPGTGLLAGAQQVPVTPET